MDNILQFLQSEDIFDNCEREDYSLGLRSYDDPMFDYASDEDCIDVSLLDEYLFQQSINEIIEACEE